MLSREIRRYMRERSRVGWISYPGFRLHCKATVIKTVWYCHKNRNIDQWNRIESPEINPRTYGQLMYNKSVKSMQWRKDNLFKKYKNWTVTGRRIKLEHLQTPHTKTQKWIKDLNVRLDTIKLLEENTDRTIFDINQSEIFSIHLLE